MKRKGLITMNFQLMIISIMLLCIGIIIYFMLKTITLQLKNIYSRIDQHAKMTEEAHKHNLDEKRRSGR
jgi:hypothetical protein